MSVRSDGFREPDSIAADTTYPQAAIQPLSAHTPVFASVWQQHSRILYIYAVRNGPKTIAVVSGSPEEPSAGNEGEQVSCSYYKTFGSSGYIDKPIQSC